MNDNWSHDSECNDFDLHAGLLNQVVPPSESNSKQLNSVTDAQSEPVCGESSHLNSDTGFCKLVGGWLSRLLIVDTALLIARALWLRFSLAGRTRLVAVKLRNVHVHTVQTGTCIASIAFSLHAYNSDSRQYSDSVVLGMPRSYSDDLRWRAVWQCRLLNKSVETVARDLYIAPRSVERWVNLFDTTGMSAPRSLSTDRLGN